MCMRYGYGISASESYVDRLTVVRDAKHQNPQISELYASLRKNG